MSNGSPLNPCTPERGLRGFAGALFFSVPSQLRPPLVREWLVAFS
jgi:hypothetical protein